MENLVPHLKKCYVKLNLDFLQKLLIKAGSNTPHANKEFAQRLKVKWNDTYRVSSTIREWFKGENNIGVRELDTILKMTGYNWSDVEKNMIFIRSGTGQPNGGVCPKFPIKIDENLGSIIGYILGDGSVYKKGLQVSFANSNKELLIDFKDKMFEIFRITPTIRYEPSNKMKMKFTWIKRVNDIQEVPNGSYGQLIYPRIIGKILIGIFDRFSLGNHKQITKNILDTTLNFKIGLIRAFFDSEDSVDKFFLNIKVFQNRRIILEKIKEILFEIGIESNKIRYDTYQVKGRNKKLYYFSITGFYNGLKFYEQIGFVSSKKMENLRNLLSNLGKSSSRHLRIMETKKLILYLLKENKYLKRKQISVLLRQLYPAHTWSNSNILFHLKDLIEQNLVERIEVNNEIIYKHKNWSEL